MARNVLSDQELNFYNNILEPVCVVALLVEGTLIVLVFVCLLLYLLNSFFRGLFRVVCRCVLRYQRSKNKPFLTSEEYRKQGEECTAAAIKDLVSSLNTMSPAEIFSLLSKLSAPACARILSLLSSSSSTSKSPRGQPRANATGANDAGEDFDVLEELHANASDMEDGLDGEGTGNDPAKSPDDIDEKQHCDKTEDEGAHRNANRAYLRQLKHMLAQDPNPPTATHSDTHPLSRSTGPPFSSAASPSSAWASSSRDYGSRGSPATSQSLQRRF
eukprot:m.108243 g.108243  ORF g.108243 m.108243 type:complete len:273 (+) comp14274_c0_seq1:223-1041(+)